MDAEIVAIASGQPRVTDANYRIGWRPMAMEDLRAIMRYIGKEHPTRAKDFGKALRDKLCCGRARHLDLSACRSRPPVYS